MGCSKFFGLFKMTTFRVEKFLSSPLASNDVIKKGLNIFVNLHVMDLEVNLFRGETQAYAKVMTKSSNATAYYDTTVKCNLNDFDF